MWYSMLYHMCARYQQRGRGAGATRLVADVFKDAVKNERIISLLGGLFTDDERVMIAHRLLIAAALARGWSYRMIRGEIGASPTTVARVHRWLERENPHYRRVISLQYTEKQKRHPHAREGTGILAFTGRNIFKSIIGTGL